MLDAKSAQHRPCPDHTAAYVYTKVRPVHLDRCTNLFDGAPAPAGKRSAWYVGSGKRMPVSPMIQPCIPCLQRRVACGSVLIRSSWSCSVAAAIAGIAWSIARWTDAASPPRASIWTASGSAPASTTGFAATRSCPGERRLVVQPWIRLRRTTTGPQRVGSRVRIEEAFGRFSDRAAR